MKYTKNEMESKNQRAIGLWSIENLKWDLKFSINDRI